MAKARDILSQKGSQILSIHPDAAVLDAAILMNDHMVGSIVVSEHGQVVGIFTERDVMRRVVAVRLDPAHTLVAQVMTRDVVCCQPDCDVDEARRIMKLRRIRHLPVVDDAQQLLGIISIGDLNAHELNGHEIHIHMLKEYLYRRV